MGLLMCLVEVPIRVTRVLLPFRMVVTLAFSACSVVLARAVTLMTVLMGLLAVNIRVLVTITWFLVLAPTILMAPLLCTMMTLLSCSVDLDGTPLAYTRKLAIRVP